jgi:folate-binding protein YgfZ
MIQTSVQAAVRADVGLIDRRLDLIDLQGEAPLALLGGLVTNDTKALKDGEGCEAAMLNFKGRLQLLVSILALPERVWVIAPPGWGERFEQLIERHAILEDIDVENISTAMSALSLQGPKAALVLADVAEIAIETLSSLAEAAPYTRHIAGTIAGHTVRIVAVDETGSRGFQIWVASDARDDVREALTAAGTPFSLVEATAEELEAMRIEAGLFAYGADAAENAFLPELPLERLVSWTKGCYLGQEPVSRVHHRGQTNRVLVGLKLQPDAPLPDPQTPLFSEDKKVGWITSVARSERFATPVALAFLRRAFIEPGTVVDVTSDQGSHPAQVAALPMVDR